MALETYGCLILTIVYYTKKRDHLNLTITETFKANKNKLLQTVTLFFLSYLVNFHQKKKNKKEFSF